MSDLTYLAKAAALYRGTAVGRGLSHLLRIQLREQDKSKENSDTDEEVVQALGLCRHCSEILVAGLNCSVTIMPSKKKGRRNCIKYQCKVCSGVTTQQGVTSRPVHKQPRKSPSKPPAVNTAPLSLLQQQRIAAGLPASFRTLESKPSAETVLNSFFTSQSSGPSLYSLFH